MWKSVAMLTWAAWLGAAAALMAGDLQVDGKLISKAPQGTAPLQVTSTTAVPNLNADLLDGLQAAAFSRKLHNVVTVSASGGDFTSIQAAIDSITGATSVNEYTVLVAPGVYQEHVTMKPFVDVVGAGTDRTTIESQGSSIFGLAPTVVLAASSRLRDVRIENLGGADYAIAVLADGLSSVVLRNVLLRATGGTALTLGLLNQDVYIVEVRDSEVQVFGSGSTDTRVGIRNISSKLNLFRSLVSAAGGTSAVAIENQGTTGAFVVRISYSELVGVDDDIASDSAFAVLVRFSELNGGGVDANGGSVKCTMLVDKYGTAYTNTCP